MNWNQPILRPSNHLLGTVLRPVTPTHLVTTAVLTLWIGTTYALSNSYPIYEAPLHYGAFFLVTGLFAYIPSAMYYWVAGLLSLPEQTDGSTQLEKSADRSAIYPRLWYTIAFRWVGIIVIAIGAALYLTVPNNANTLGNVVFGISTATILAGGSVFGISLLAPLAVYRERKFLTEEAEWYPSRWYYLTLFPTGLLGILLSIAYTRRRLRNYGYQSARQIALERLL